MEKREFPRIAVTFPVELMSNDGESSGQMVARGRTVDLSRSGAKLVLDRPLPTSFIGMLNIDMPQDYSREPSKIRQVQTDIRLVWPNPTLKEEWVHYGLSFPELSAYPLKELFGEINKQQIAAFFNVPLPTCLKENYGNNYILEKLDQRQIMGIIDFRPPFLKIEKMVILGSNSENVLQTNGLGTGLITIEDTAGHYNDTIFLAMCGQLMASAASIHLAALFLSMAPQVVEANGIKPLPLPEEKKGCWKPALSGTTFFVESNIVKKKLQLAVVKTTITFADICYGVIEELKLVLTPRKSVWSARSFPPSFTLRS